MESNNNRNYDQGDGNSQDSQNSQSPDRKDDTLQMGTSDNRNVGNIENSERGSNYNPSSLVSGTNPDPYNAFTDGGAEGPSETFTETDRYSASNSDFDERKSEDQDESIPNSEDIEDEDSDFQDS